MNTKRFAFSVIASFIFIFCVEFFWHGVLLVDSYGATADLWRPEGNHERYMLYMFASQYFQALLLAFIFTRNYEGKGLMEGLRFGLYMGLLLASLDFGKYCYMPVPFSLVVAWIAGTMVKTLGVGAVLALTYKK